jgi:serine/threonine protein kinase
MRQGPTVQGNLPLGVTAFRPEMVTVPICQAVQHAHPEGISHHDIKRSNTLLHDGVADDADHVTGAVPLVDGGICLRAAHE